MLINHPAETLLIEGADAVAFAHAQFSSKVTSLPSQRWQFSSWLDPQGRVRALFHIARIADDRLLLLLRGGSAAAMARTLQPYVFRSKLTLSAATPGALSKGAALPLFELQLNQGTVALGCGTHSLHIGADVVQDDAWRLPQMHEGWPWLPEDGLGKWLAASLSLQRLQAVTIDKGCYPGQEIVARLHYRGGNKRHLHRVELSQPCSPGETFYLGEQTAGFVVDVLLNEDRINALVILNDELVQNSRDGKLGAFSNGMSMQLCQQWTT